MEMSQKNELAVSSRRGDIESLRAIGAREREKWTLLRVMEEFSSSWKSKLERAMDSVEQKQLSITLSRFV